MVSDERAHRPAPGRPVPTATYRLQVEPGFTFDDAAEQVERLASLGVSHLYLSPVLQAAPGSTHGYDVVDHTRVSREAGGVEALRELARRAHAAGLGLVADVVPNHMATPTPEHLNAPWWSLLGQGRESPYAHWFDVDWAAQDDRVLVPVLGGPVDDAVAAGEVTVAHDGGPAGDETVVRYYEHELPVRAGTEGLPLPELLERQWYRLDDWRLGGTELNYRRFFDVTSLVAIRVEDEDVFDATHGLLLELLAEGTLDGLRIDHPDGLSDPSGYLDRLSRATGGAWVVVEKILEGDEALPEDWACAGTTGYDALARVGGVFVDPSGEAGLTAEWRAVSGSATPLADVVTDAKRHVAADVLGSEVARLLQSASRLLPDHDPDALRQGLVELLVAMDRYRAYVVPGEPVGDVARTALADAAEVAASRLDPADRPALEALHGLVLGEPPAGALAGDGADRHDLADLADLVVRFQQTCGPVMAKGIEDTAFYRYLRLTALNEVGGDPGRVGTDPAELDRFARHVLATWPTTMTTLTTHDTKRSEDVRARLAVLAERADDWRSWLARVREATAAERPALLDGPTEYLIWQTLVGAWPITADRLHGYLEKAVREAKTHTTWTDQDPDYEQAVHAFADAVLASPAARSLVEEWVEATAPAARAVVLGQKLLQLVHPGVPDIFQGREVVDLSLVDPDNRRPVDHTEIARAQESLDTGTEPHGLDDEKLLVTTAALRLRKDHPEWFTGPDATWSLLPTGDGQHGHGGHVLAAARGDGPARVLAVVTRFAGRLADAGGWGGTRLDLPEGEWRDLLGGHTATGSVALADLLTEMPVALLVREDS